MRFTNTQASQAGWYKKQPMDTGFTSLEVLIAFAVGLACGLILLAVFLVRANLRWRDNLQKARNQSVRQSASTLRGQIAEELAPLLPGFEYNPADCKFLGDPIDYVVFNGLSAARHADADPDAIEVVLLDIKHGRAGLTKHQHAIAEAIEHGRVRFRTVRIADDYSVASHDYRLRRSR